MTVAAEINKAKKNIAWDVVRKTGGYMAKGVSEYFSDAMPNMRSVTNDVGAEINGLRKKMETRATQDVRQGSRSIRVKSGMRAILRWYLQEGEEYESAESEGDKLSYDTGEGAVQDDAMMEINEQQRNANQISAAVTKGLQKNLEGQVELTSEINHTLVEINTTVTTGFDKISAKLDELVKVYTKNSATQIEATVAAAKQSENMDPVAKMFREGRFNMESYKQILSSNVNQALMDYVGPLGPIIQQFLPMLMDLDLLKQLKPEDLLAFAVGPMVEKIVPGLKTEMQKLDKSLSDGILDMLLKAGESNRDNRLSFSTILGKIFGIKPTRQDQSTSATRAELSTVGAVPFDNLTRESIINTIPGYLREITRLLGGKDMVYDYQKRTFRTQKEIDDEFHNLTAPTNMLSDPGMAKYKDQFYNDQFTNVAYDQMINHLRASVEDGSYADIIRNFGDVEATKQYLREVVFHGVKLSEAEQERLDEMAVSLANVKAMNGLGAIKDQATKGNIDRNSNVKSYIENAKTYNLDLRHLQDSYAEDRKYIFARAGLAQEPDNVEGEASVNINTTTAPEDLVGLDYTNMALYEIYRRLNVGINVFRVGSSDSQKKRFPHLEDSHLPPPKVYKPKQIQDESSSSDDDLLKGTRGAAPVLDENGNPVDPRNPLLKDGEDDTRNTITRVGDWARGRGGQLWQAVRHGDAAEIRSVLGDSANDVIQASGIALKNTIAKADKQFGNISGWLRHKLTGKAYSFEDVDENGEPVTKYIAENEGGGLFGVATKYLSDLFEGPKQYGKDWIHDVLGYFDYSNDGTNKEDRGVVSKRKRIMAAAVGAFAGAGILGGPIGMIAGAVAGSAVIGSGLGQRIKEMFFGRDEAGKAKGLLTKMGDAIVLPISYQFAKTAHTFGNAIKRNILGPLSDLGSALRDRIMSHADTAFGKFFKGLVSALTFIPRNLLKAGGWIGGKVAGGIAGVMPGMAGGAARGAIRGGTGLVGGMLTSMANSLSKHSGQKHIITDPETGEEMELSSYEYQKYRRKQRKGDTKAFMSYKDFVAGAHKKGKQLKQDLSDATAEREMTPEEIAAYQATQETAEAAKRTADASEAAATATVHLDTLGSDEGSIFVHDNGVHSRIDQIIQILSGMTGYEAPPVDDHAEKAPDVKPADQPAAEVAGLSPEEIANLPSTPFELDNMTAAEREDYAAAEAANVKRDNDNEVAASAMAAAAQISSSSDGISEQEAALSKKVFKEAAKPDSSAADITETLGKLQDLNEEGKAAASEKKEKDDENIIDKIFSAFGGGLGTILENILPIGAIAAFFLSDDFRNFVLDTGGQLIKGLLENLPSVISAAWDLIKNAASMADKATEAIVSHSTLEQNPVTGEWENVVSAEQHASEVEGGLADAAWTEARHPLQLWKDLKLNALARTVTGGATSLVGLGTKAAGNWIANATSKGTLQGIQNSLTQGSISKETAERMTTAVLDSATGSGARKAGETMVDVGQDIAGKINVRNLNAKSLITTGGTWLAGMAGTIGSDFGYRWAEKDSHGNWVGDFGTGIQAGGYVKTNQNIHTATTTVMGIAASVSFKGAMGLLAATASTGGTALIAVGVIAAIAAISVGIGYCISKAVGWIKNSSDTDYSVRSNIVRMEKAIEGAITYDGTRNDPMYVYYGQDSDRILGLTDGMAVKDPEVLIGDIMKSICESNTSLPGAEVLFYDLINNMAVQGVPFAVALAGDSKSVKRSGDQANSTVGDPPKVGSGNNKTQVLKSRVETYETEIMNDIATNIERYNSAVIWDLHQDLGFCYDQGKSVHDMLSSCGILKSNGKLDTGKFKGAPGTNNGKGWDELEKICRSHDSYTLCQCLVYINSKVEVKNNKQWIEAHNSDIEKLLENLADVLGLEKDARKEELKQQGYSDAEAQEIIDNTVTATAQIAAKAAADPVEDTTYASYKAIESSSIRNEDKADVAKELRYLSAAYAYAHPEMLVEWAKKNQAQSGINPSYVNDNTLVNWNSGSAKDKARYKADLEKLALAYADTHGDIFGLMKYYDFTKGGKVYPVSNGAPIMSDMYGTGFLLRGYNWEGQGKLDKIFEGDGLSQSKTPDAMHKLLFGKTEHGKASEATKTSDQDWTLSGSGLLAEIADRMHLYTNSAGDALATGDNNNAWRNILVNLPAGNPPNVNVNDSAEGVVKNVGGPLDNSYKPAAEFDRSHLGAAVPAAASGLIDDGGGGGTYYNDEDYNAAEADLGSDEGGNPLNKDFRVTSGFGWRDLNMDGQKDDYHTGIDIAPADGSDIAEVGSRYNGTISKVTSNVPDSHTGLNQTSESEGNQVWIDTDDGKRIKMMHLKAGSIPTYLKEGSRVQPGDFIGEMGSTGRSSGPHLHYQVERSAKDETSAMNPKSGISKGSKYDSFLREDRGDGSGTGYYGDYGYGTYGTGDDESFTISSLADFIKALTSAGSKVLSKITGGLLGSESEESSNASITDSMATYNGSLYGGSITGTGSAADFLKFCANEIGTTEEPAGSNRTKYGKWYGMDGAAWCMMFVQWCFSNYGIPLKFKTASCKELINYFKSHDSSRVMDSKATPQPGDLIFMTFQDSRVTQHVGIVEAVDNGTFITIEGNTSPSAEFGSQYNGDGVYRKRRKRSCVTYFIHAHDFNTTGGSVADVSNNEEGIWKYLKQRGLSDQAAAGVMGNFYAESSFKSNNLQGDYEKALGHTDESYTKAVDDGTYSRYKFMHDSAGYGLAQWTYHSRKAGLYDYAKTMGKSIGDHNMQLDHFWQTIQEGQKPTVYTQLKNASSVDDASDIMMKSYEDPADQEHQGPKRRNYSKQYYDRWHGIGGPIADEDGNLADAQLNMPDANVPDEPIGGPRPAPELEVDQGAGTKKSSDPASMYGDLDTAQIVEPDLDIQDAFLKRARHLIKVKERGDRKQEELMDELRKSMDPDYVPTRIGGPVSDMSAPVKPVTGFQLKDDATLFANTPTEIQVNKNEINNIDLTALLNALATITSYLAQITTNTGATTDQMSLLAENGFVDKDLRDQFDQLGKKLKQQSSKSTFGSTTRSNSRVVSNLVRP